MASQVNEIARGVRLILASPTGSALETGASLESLYTLTERTVLTGVQSAENLYEKVKMELERGIGEVASSLKAGPSNQSMVACQSWLQRLESSWQDWLFKTTIVESVLTLLDQAYLLEQPDLSCLKELSLDLFLHAITLNEDLQLHASACIVACVNGERYQPGSSYQSLHLLLISMYTKLACYSLVEKALHQATTSFYEAECEEKFSQLTISQYLVHVQNLLEEEQVRGAWLFSDDGGRKTNMTSAQDLLIKSHAQALIEGLPQLLDEGSVEPMNLLYRLLAKVGELAPLRSAFGKFVIVKGENIVKEKEKDDTMIERLLEYKATIDMTVAKAFLKDSNFHQTQKESFEAFVNKRENKPAELIAKFLDARLRSGNKTMSDSELEHVLNEALILFRYTHAKDMFEEFYKRLFAKRLLLNRSASSDAEQSMLLKLKEECGPGFTQKLETMLTDISLSDEMMKAFTALQEKATLEGKGDDFELSVNVLTQAHWPTYPQIDVIIPAEMTRATERFHEFYESRNQGRKLQWAHTLGTTSLIAQFAKAGEKELLVSTFQTVVLLLFNGLTSGGKLNFREIKEQTGLESKELKRTLQSLACGQIPTRILRKEPQGKEVNEEDEFTINEGIKNDRKRIRINMIQLNETKEEQKSTVDRVMFDRELVLQASAVRILKAKKTIKHAELLQEIVKQIASRFTVDVNEIKKTFEILIDKEYMERVEGQRGMYRYLA
ncbi:hypothetical protein CBS101457_003626 [Exobasidium rhododendri]|nr:hypothetical protein CBS101457_003626 [Exobasidium rhododendri]